MNWPSRTLPKALGASDDEQHRTSPAAAAESLRTTRATANNFVLGAFGDRLVGTTGSYRGRSVKIRQKLPGGQRDYDAMRSDEESAR